jgi:hypothetical protein
VAKITVNADTETEILEVIVNGEVLANVQEVSFSVYEDPYDGDTELCTRIAMLNKNKDTGITTVTYLTAKQSKAGKQAIASGAKLNKRFVDFVQTEDSNKLKSDIMKYLSY